MATLVAVVDRQGHCLHANAALEAALGLPRRSLVGEDVRGWLVDPAPLHEVLAQLDRGELASSRLLAQLHPPAGSVQAGPQPLERAVQLSVSALDAPAGGVLLEMSALDLQLRSERERRIQELAQANGELLRNLAHEVRNPLGGIRGAAQLLLMEPTAPALAECAQLIVREADRLHALVDRLLAPHRGALRVGDVNLHEVCEHVRALVQAEYGPALVIERDYDTSIPEFRGDRGQLVQAVLNVVRNAAQALAASATPQPRIVLRTRVRRQVTLGGRRHRLALALQVQDNGPGVPEAMRERIFHPLVSGREGGSGLGLTLAHAILQQHRGTIECEAAPGCSVFTLSIPLN
ncbi:MAG: PAS domain-containing sensor histidine kinase [Rubrivivax sp. SCN 71-131]|nr:MAG: PAS domain-containing sensor histidine kinase [Rubrivivax sp. SCN 71-131]